MGEGPAGLALRERRTVVAGEGEAGFSPQAAGARSALAVPILSGEEVAAVLYVEGDRPGAFDRGQVITLQTLADGIGILLRTAELYETLEDTNARLVELDRTKSELVNVVAHDFRAPLAAILGWAELLEAQADAPLEERRARARSIVAAATRMAGLMDRTLETTRLETGQFVFDFRLRGPRRAACERPPPTSRPTRPTPSSSTCPTSPCPAGRTASGSRRWSRTCSRTPSSTHRAGERSASRRAASGRRPS